jgi:hypothetical protein
MFWNASLSYVVTPKSGPVRPMRTLDDAKSALIHDLPPGATKRPHWLQAGFRVVTASESGLPDDIHAATEALVAALEAESWMTRPQKDAG